MPEVKHPLELIGHCPTRNKRRCGFEGKCVFDAVIQQACVRIDRLEPMRMLPARERSLELDVRELPARNTFAMLGDPRHRQRTDTELQYGPRTIADPACVLQQFNRLPRRRQSLQGSPAGVPVVYLSAGKRQTTRLMEHMECHSVLLPARSFRVDG